MPIPENVVTTGSLFARAKREDLPTGEALLQADAAPRFTFWCSPKEYYVRKGEILPMLSKLKRIPGLNGVDKNGGTVRAEMAHKRKGRIEIPENTPVVAFGVQRPSYLDDPYKVPQGHRWTDVWTRPKVIAGRVIWEIDEDGYLDFLRWVRDNVLPPIDPTIKAEVIASARTAYEVVAERPGSPRNAQAAADMLANLPPEVAAEVGPAPVPSTAADAAGRRKRSV